MEAQPYTSVTCIFIQGAPKVSACQMMLILSGCSWRLPCVWKRTAFGVTVYLRWFCRQLEKVVMRLHLIIADTRRKWTYQCQGIRYVKDQLGWAEDRCAPLIGAATQFVEQGMPRSTDASQYNFPTRKGLQLVEWCLSTRHLEDSSQWMAQITMVIVFVPQGSGNVGPLPNGRTSWLINGGNFLTTVSVLPSNSPSSKQEKSIPLKMWRGALFVFPRWKRLANRCLDVLDVGDFCFTTFCSMINHHHQWNITIFVVGGDISWNFFQARLFENLRLVKCWNPQLPQNTWGLKNIQTCFEQILLE